MARLFDDASNEYLEYGTALVTTPPFTMACWFQSDSLTAYQTLMAVSDTAAGGQNYMLMAAGGIAGDPVAAFVNEAVAATSTTGYSASTWHHACGVFSATNARAAYIDGGSKGTEATLVSPSGLDVTTIGILHKNVLAYPLSGVVAEAAIWDVALTDDEVAILAHGYSPLLVRPQNLVAYWPLIRDEDQDRVGGYNLTDYNTPSIADHPPKVRYPGVRNLGKPPPLVTYWPRHPAQYNELFIY